MFSRVDLVLNQTLVQKRCPKDYWFFLYPGQRWKELSFVESGIWAYHSWQVDPGMGQNSNSRQPLHSLKLGRRAPWPGQGTGVGTFPRPSKSRNLQMGISGSVWSQTLMLSLTRFGSSNINKEPSCSKCFRCGSFSLSLRRHSLSGPSWWEALLLTTDWSTLN